MPRGFGQFDTAERAERLGLGVALSYRRIAQVDHALRRVLDTPDLARRARELAEQPNHAAAIIPWLESVAARPAA